MGLTIAEMARRTGLAEATVRRYESGDFAIPAGIGPVLEKLKRKVLQAEIRWALLTPEEIERTKDWRAKEAGWTVYPGEEGARLAAVPLPGIPQTTKRIVQVGVRRKKEVSTYWELWSEIRVVALAETKRMC